MGARIFLLLLSLSLFSWGAPLRVNQLPEAEGEGVSPVSLQFLKDALQVELATSPDFLLAQDSPYRLHALLAKEEEEFVLTLSLNVAEGKLMEAVVSEKLKEKEPSASLLRGDLHELAKKGVMQLSELFRLKGSVVKVEGKEATFHLLKAKTLPKGTPVHFVREQHLVGRGTVVRSGVAEFVAKVEKGEAAPDDLVYPWKLSTPSKKPGKRHHDLWKTALLALGGATAAFFIFQKKRGSTPTASQQQTIASKAKSVQLTANPTSIPADGFSVSVITALAKDANNVAVEDGTPVAFATTAGTIVISGGASVAMTVNGQVQVNLVAPSSAGSATVTATSGEASSSVGVTFTATSSPPAAIDLTAAADPVSIASSGANAGRAVTTLTATVTDSAGKAVPDGTTVTFSTTLGSVTGQASTVGGTATSTFSSTTTGTATITAKAGQVTQTLTLTVQPGAPVALSVAANPQVIEADGNTFSTITATVRDSGGNLVADGTQVDFSVTPDAQGGGNGDITSSSFTVNGQAQAILISRVPGTANTPANSGTATIVATVPTTQPTGIPAPTLAISNSKTQVTFVSKVASDLNFSASVPNLRGLDFINKTATITVLVFDKNGNPVPDGTAVFFSVLGTVKNGVIQGDGPTVGGVAESKTQGGQATATFFTNACSDLSGFTGDLATTAPPAGGVCDPDGAGPFTPGQVPIRVVSGSVSRDKVPLIVSGPAHATFTSITSPLDAQGDDGSSAAKPYTLGICKDSVTVTVNGRDINGNPVADGLSIEFKASKGTLIADTAFQGGIAQATIQTATDCSTGTTSTGPGLLSITIKNAPASNLSLSWFYEVK